MPEDFESRRTAASHNSLERGKERRRDLHITSFFSIPQEVLPGEPVITITGRNSVYIENYRRIECFCEDEIRLRARTCRVSVTGKRLKIEYYTQDEMLIAGQIISVSMEV